MYLVRQQFPRVYEIANFTYRKEPDAVYHIRNGKCSCPAAWGKKSCKHQALLKSFLACEPGFWFFDIIGDKVVPNKVLNELLT